MLRSSWECFELTDHERPEDKTACNETETFCVESRGLTELSTTSWTSKNLWTGKLKPSSELLTLTPGQYVGADSFVQFTNEFLYSLFGVGDETQLVTWLFQVKLHAQDFTARVEIQQLVLA